MLLALALVLALLSSVAFAVLTEPARAPATWALPQPTNPERYVGSGACRSCHPAEYASWRRTYHRSMTQPATQTSVLAPFDVTLDWHGQKVSLFERSGRFYAKLPDLELVSQLLKRGVALDTVELQTVESPVVMTTGSHHYQAYWLPGVRGNELRQLPFVYLLDERRFIEREAAFLQPPDAPVHIARWNSSCVTCHSVAGRPKHFLSSDRFETQAAELGIACEACHGPGARHIAQYKNPLSRYQQHWSSAKDDTIVNPVRLDAARSAAVCGQCHAYFIPRSEGRWWQLGYTDHYEPGRRLSEGRQLISYGKSQVVHAALPDVLLSSVFWRDGAVRVGGREYNGLVESPCYRKGRGERRLSCLSCHAMHAGNPAGQLRPVENEDELCTQCHDQQASRLVEHTHHAAGSPGSRCVNCHMPKTAYALFRAIRSHTIQSPGPSTSGAATEGRSQPNACSLCHLDRSQSWVNTMLMSWYGSGESAEKPAEAVAESVVGALTGDAAERAIWAAALGEPAARRTAGQSWQPLVLIELLSDPYAAVRKLAFESLKRFDTFSDMPFDFTKSEQDAAQRNAWLRFAAHASGEGQGRIPARPEVLLTSEGRMDEKAVRALRSRRDDTPVMIAE